MYRFGQAALAIGVPEQTLRNWLHRHKAIDLSGARPEGGWRSFAEEDVFVLAVAARLFRYGCPFEKAVEEVRTTLDPDWLRKPASVPKYLFAAETPIGWAAATEEGLLWAYADQQLTDLVRIHLPIVFKRARQALAAGDRGND